ncbi:MAG: methyltransferase domain-containing protein [Proteobacteria bacterium]|nr:methyltransferase domain-containing protein [Pseudomonadota bacterium]
MTGTPLKLHLGCGKKRLPGYVNIDIGEASAADMRADLRSLPFAPGSVEAIYSCAVIEHFGRNEWVGVLKHWHALLKPGGKLWISTSDFDAAVVQYGTDKNLPQLLGLLIGGQKDDYDWHGMIFNETVMRQGLAEAGFTNIARYDWRDFDVGRLGLDDYSQAYLPHMDKEHGRLMMLNLVAQKK